MPNKRSRAGAYLWVLILNIFHTSQFSNLFFNRENCPLLICLNYSVDADTQDKLTHPNRVSCSDTLLGLVPFPARHLEYEIQYLLITFVVLTPPRFSLRPSASVSTDRKPWRMQMNWPFVRGWDTTDYEKGLCHSEPSYIPQNSEFTLWIWLGDSMNSSHEM